MTASNSVDAAVSISSSSISFVIEMCIRDSPDLVKGGYIAELVFVAARFICVDNAGDITVAQDVLIFALLEVPVSGSVDEQNVPTGAVLLEYQNAGRDTGAVKQVGGQADDRVKHCLLYTSRCV